MKKIRINLAKIPKSAEYIGQNGARYVDITLFDNKDGKDQYGNDGFAALDVTKEQREAGERGPIIGNWKELGGKRPQASQEPRQAAPQRSADYPRQPRPSQRPAPTDPDLDAPEEPEIPF